MNFLHSSSFSFPDYLTLLSKLAHLGESDGSVEVLSKCLRGRGCWGQCSSYLLIRSIGNYSILPKPWNNIGALAAPPLTITPTTSGVTSEVKHVTYLSLYVLYALPGHYLLLALLYQVSFALKTTPLQFISLILVARLKQARTLLAQPRLHLRVLPLAPPVVKRPQNLSLPLSSQPLRCPYPLKVALRHLKGLYRTLWIVLFQINQGTKN